MIILSIRGIVKAFFSLLENSYRDITLEK